MLAIKTAEELMELDLAGRWATRRVARENDALRAILRAFVCRGGPVPVQEIVTGFPDSGRAAVAQAIAALDQDDLIEVAGGRIATAYPFSASPTPFVVRLAGGEERYACCALDALGVAPMLGGPTRVTSRCHDCQAGLAFGVFPHGPGLETAELMVWIAPPREGERRVITGL